MNLSTEQTLRAAIITAMAAIENPKPAGASEEELQAIEVERQNFGMMFLQTTTDDLVDWLVEALKDGRVRLQTQLGQGGP